MNQPDELFEQKMQDIESGKPIKDVLSSLPKEADELAALLRTAVTTRQVAAPSINPTAARRQKAGVMAKVNRRKAGFSIWMAIAAGGAALLLLVFFAAALAGGLLINNRTEAQQVTLMDISGVVAVLPPGDQAEWTFEENGDKAKEGALIRTYADSSVTLLYYDGTRTTLDPGTELLLSDLGGGGRTLKVTLDQRSGTTHHSVVPLQGSDSFFNVNTPTGKVSVHGTVFSVNVVPGAGSLYIVDRGQVQVSNQRGQVILTAGQGLSRHRRPRIYLQSARRTDRDDCHPLGGAGRRF
jgi:ferric-dicitrate binding protein FerR (iron transport regulator)